MDTARDTARRGTETPRPGLAGNATWRLAGTVFRVTVGVLSVPLYTRLLGMSQWGLLALFQAMIPPLAMLDLGLGSATVKYVAEALGRDDRDGAVRVVHTTLLFSLGMGLAGAAVLLAASRWLASSVFEIPPADLERAVLGFRLMALGGILALVTATFAAVVSAHQRYDAFTRITTLAAAASVASGLAAAASGGDATRVLLAQTAAAGFTTWLWFRAATPLLPRVASLPRWDPATFRRSIAFGAWELVWAGGGMIAATAGKYVLGAHFLPAAVGFFAIAQMLSSQLVGAFTEMGEVLFPAVSHLEGEGRLQDARRLSLLVAWTLTTGFGIVANTLAIGGGDFLHLWISPEAAQAATTTLRLLCAAGILGIAMTAPLNYVAGTGRTRLRAAVAVNSVLGLTVGGLSVLLVPRYGLAGAGWALVAGFAAEWVFLVLIWKSHFAVEYRFREYAACVFAPPLVSLAILAAGTRLHDALGLVPTWPKLFLEVACILLAVGVAQLAAGELLPGGPGRRRDVVSSLAPVLRRTVRFLAR